MLHEQIETDLKSALKSGNKEKTSTLRFLVSAIKNLQIERRAQEEQYLPDNDVISVLKQQAKQRKDSVIQYEKGGRTDLAEKERKELAMIGSYLPEQISEEAIEKIVESKMAELGVVERAGFGKLMGAVMKELQGKADGNAVKEIIEKKLSVSRP